MVGVGEAAPDFVAKGSAGSSVRLAELRGHPVILYFYPKASTPGCTIETKAFRDLHPEFTKRGVKVLGVSTDEVEDQDTFAKNCSVPFPLLADPSKEITRKYGVLGLAGVARRVTFFIAADGKVAEIVDSSRPGPHVDRARDLYLAPP
ncbi:MAG TPA: peroxiredoxin [Thermoplasmata archaeon]|nr:peroxiredoxin [Thermoplasmata archaeon]